MARLPKISATSATSATSKSNFIKYPRFAIVGDGEVYTSKTTGKTRWMYQLASEDAKKLTPEMARICTQRNGKVYAHVSHENKSGFIQYGVYPGSTTGAQGFMNVAASADEILVLKLSKIDRLVKDGQISKEFGEERRKAAYEEFCKSQGI